MDFQGDPRFFRRPVRPRPVGDPLLHVRLQIHLPMVDRLPGLPQQVRVEAMSLQTQVQVPLHQLLSGDDEFRHPPALLRRHTIFAAAVAVQADFLHLRLHLVVGDVELQVRHPVLEGPEFGLAVAQVAVADEDDASDEPNFDVGFMCRPGDEPLFGPVVAL